MKVRKNDCMCDEPHAMPPFISLPTLLYSVMIPMPLDTCASVSVCTSSLLFSSLYDVFHDYLQRSHFFYSSFKVKYVSRMTRFLTHRRAPCNHAHDQSDFFADI